MPPLKMQKYWKLKKEPILYLALCLHHFLRSRKERDGTYLKLTLIPEATDSHLAEKCVKNAAIQITTLFWHIVPRIEGEN